MIGKIATHIPLIVVGGLVAFAACQQAPDSVVQTMQEAELPAPLLDYVEKSGEAIDEVQRRIEAIERVSVGTLDRKESRERELINQVAEFQAYDAEVWSLFDQFILAKSWEIFDNAQTRAREQNTSIEWQLQTQATHLTDQLWAIASPYQGNISMQDGPDRDKFSDALTDAMAMSALLGQIMSGETPFYSQVNANDLISSSKALSEGLYTVASLQMPLRSASQIPQVQPVAGELPVEAGVQNASNE